MRRAIANDEHVERVKHLPVSVWVRLYAQLEPFLSIKNIDDAPLMNFFHRQVAQVADECRNSSLHTKLAEYFGGLKTKKDGQYVYPKRTLSELPYQLHHAGDKHPLDELLLDPNWMRQKLEAFGGPQELIGDYRAFAPYDSTNKSPMALVGRALGQSAAPLSRDKRQLIPHLLGRLRPDMGAQIEGLRNHALALVQAPSILSQFPNLIPADDPLIHTIEGHANWITTVAFSPCGRYFASGSGDQTVRLWNAETNEELHRFEGTGCGIRSIAFSEDGRYLASGSEDTAVRLWDAITGNFLCSFIGHDSMVNSVAFSPCGQYIASGSEDTIVRLWDIETCKEARRFAGHGPQSGQLLFPQMVVT